MIPNDPAYLADKPKLRAALSGLEAALPEIARLAGERADANAAEERSYAAALAESKERLARHGVDRHADLPEDAKAEANAMWERHKLLVEEVSRRQKLVTDAWEAVKQGFIAAEDEDSHCAGAFRWGGYRGCGIDDMVRKASHLGLRARVRDLQARTYAAPRIEANQARVGMTLFLADDCSARKVVKLTPTGMVDMASLLTGDILRLRPNKWPRAVHRLTAAFAKQLLEARDEWLRAFPNGG